LHLNTNEKGENDPDVLRMALMQYVKAEIEKRDPSDEEASGWKRKDKRQIAEWTKARTDEEFCKRMNQDIQTIIFPVFKRVIQYWLQPAHSFVLFVRLSGTEWEGAFQVILQRLASDLSLKRKLGTYGFRFIQSSTSLPVAVKERMSLDQMPTVPLASRREVQLEPVLQPFEQSLFATGITCAEDEMKIMEVIARLASKWYRLSAAGSAPQDAVSTYAEICRGIKLLSEVSIEKTATTAAGVCQVGGHGRLNRQSLRGPDPTHSIYPGNTHYGNVID